MKWRRIPGIKKLLLGTALAGLTFASAVAADMPAYPVAPPPPPPPGIPDCWTGFYVGGNLGYHFGQDSISVSANPNGWGAPAADAINSQTATWLAPRGTVVGGQIGYNWQVANIVVGWEGDGQWLGGTSNRQYTLNSAFVAPGDFMYNSSAENVMATLRARLGWAFGNYPRLRHRRRRHGLVLEHQFLRGVQRDSARDDAEHDGAPGLDRRRRDRVEIPAGLVGQSRVSLLPHAELQHDDPGQLPGQRHRRSPQLPPTISSASA